MMQEPRYWSSWKGRVIRAIALDGIYTKNGIHEATGLTESRLETVLDEMLKSNLLKTMWKERYWVNSSELVNEYREFFEKLQASLREWLTGWIKHEGIDFESDHFFLEDRLLEELSIRLIEQAKVEILVANPFVERCHLSNALMEASKKGIRVRLITRNPGLDRSQYLKKKQDYHTKLKEKGVTVAYDNAVHAKLTVVDRAIAVVSSMNFYASSSGGASWETGIVSLEEIVVQQIARSILNRFE